MADLMRAKDILGAIKGHKELYEQRKLHGVAVKGYLLAHDDITDLISRTVPTVDAVEVVRCKDCRFWHNDGIMTTCDRLFGNGYEANWFCANGERKDNGNV